MEEFEKAYLNLQETKKNVLAGINERHKDLDEAIHSLNKTLEENKNLHSSNKEVFDEINSMLNELLA